jgi:hypothetical protein
VVERRVERVLRVLERLEVGAVTGDLPVAGQLALAVVQRGDHHVAPEPGPVLAQPPTAVLDPTGLAGDREQRLGQPGLAVLLGVEHREAAADRLVGGVALELLGPPVPGPNLSLGVQTDDRVVDDLADQEPEAFLALAQPGLELVLLGEVPGHLGVAGQVTVVVVQGGDDRVGPEPGPVLADAPPRLLDPAGLTGLLEHKLGQPGRAVLVGVEHREVATDGLLGGIALDPFRAAVPRTDPAVDVEAEDGVVDHLLDHAIERVVFLRSPPHAERIGDNCMIWPVHLRAVS